LDIAPLCDIINNIAAMKSNNAQSNNTLKGNDAFMTSSCHRSIFMACNRTRPRAMTSGMSGGRAIC
jgi:hypothetical protein